MILKYSAAGPDNIPSILLKECSEELAVPLKMLWTKSIETGVIPNKLKEAIITPIHKGGSRGTSSNYRPVALTSHIIKIIERIVKKKIVEHLENKNLFNKTNMVLDLDDLVCQNY